MNREEMLQTLQSLHAELADADSVDNETRQLLQALTDDIHKVLTSHERRSESAEHLSLLQRLRETVIDFEFPWLS